ncbi:hypothetical protein ABZ153_19190 [Streptomyces sp. NPDC006290]|uniref:hypothetical protein n=1 Tax=Streptomyces sp. NPDC006290 TaxID=3156745 RepID=UPI0033ADF780
MDPAHEPVFTNLAAGAPEALALLVSNYQCGSCGGEVETLATTGDIVHANVSHDDNCPVLNGHVSSTGDLARAATGHIPATFRP